MPGPITKDDVNNIKRPVRNANFRLFQQAYWRYRFSLQSYQAHESYREQRLDQEPINIDATFVFYRHGIAQMQEESFHLVTDDRLLFFKRMRPARKNKRIIQELRAMLVEWRRTHPYYPTENWIEAQFGVLMNRQQEFYKIRVAQNTGHRLIYEHVDGASGFIQLDQQGDLQVFQQVSAPNRQGVIASTTMTYVRAPSGSLYLQSVVRKTHRDDRQLSIQAWNWTNPRSVRASMSLGKTLASGPALDVGLLLALTEQVAQYDLDLSDVTAIETKHLEVRRRGQIKKRDLTSEFSVIPLSASPDERLELRIIQRVDRRNVKRQGDLMDLMARDFKDRRDELARINAFSDQYDIGGSPHGFTLNLAPCFNEHWLGLFDHRPRDDINGIVIESRQTRGRGIVRVDLLAFRPKFTTYLNHDGIIQRVHMHYEMVPPYTTNIDFRYQQDHLGRLFPTEITYTLNRGQIVEERKHYQYGPFNTIKSLVTTEIHSGVNGEN